MFKNKSSLSGLCLLLIASVGMSCSDKKEKQNYDLIESSEIIVKEMPFKVEIINPNLKTVQEIQYTGKKMGDFYKIESHQYKLEEGDKKMLLGKSYLVNAEKYNRVTALLMDQVKLDTLTMVISPENPVIIAISVGKEQEAKSIQLDIKAASPFEVVLFKLLDGEAKSEPVKIPTH
ncbi:hypothetical protein [Flavobacterium sp. NKUCC04_CG]|uniref:hypothetical protein n=1 Tax=Flavobacterium sp. NKUCC04_CG TaxID=2842121 RepID=UPI001C5B650E|nr:hypothetical protein [Flavobacterium sp. NKUCC04_CG]MBW3518647.1 hypothetical protein [Flavobacterium sp. NKUCC04_CG]